MITSTASTVCYRIAILQTDSVLEIFKIYQLHWGCVRLAFSSMRFLGKIIIFLIWIFEKSIVFVDWRDQGVVFRNLVLDNPWLIVKISKNFSCIKQKLQNCICLGVEIYSLEL